jgi:hypothetical protein
VITFCQPLCGGPSPRLASKWVVMAWVGLRVAAELSEGEFKEVFGATTMLRRTAQPREIAQACLWLASEVRIDCLFRNWWAWLRLGVSAGDKFSVLRLTGGHV